MAEDIIAPMSRLKKYISQAHCNVVFRPSEPGEPANRPVLEVLEGRGALPLTPVQARDLAAHLVMLADAAEAAAVAAGSAGDGQ